jgi:ABC-type branched-subunit amino acid transport system substrate-binding protein
VGVSRLDLTDDRSVGQLVLDIEAASVDAVFFSGVDSAALADLWIRLRPGLGAWSFIGTGAIGTGFAERAGEAAKGAEVFVAAHDPALLEQRGTDFIERFRERYGEVGFVAADAYDAAHVVLDAIERAGERWSGASISQVRHFVLDEIAATRGFASSVGTISFDEAGDAHPQFVTKYLISNGQLYPDRLFRVP